ncbi:MAG: hypothetical protein ACI4TK_10905 [Agathobacter sp.]
MEDIEYNQRTNPIVIFLTRIFSDDMNVLANIVTEQAEQNTKMLIHRLKLINDVVSGWIEELKEIDKKNESKKD